MLQKIKCWLYTKQKRAPFSILNSIIMYEGERDLYFDRAVVIQSKMNEFCDVAVSWLRDNNRHIRVVEGEGTYEPNEDTFEFFITGTPMAIHWSGSVNEFLSKKPKDIYNLDRISHETK